MSKLSELRKVANSYAELRAQRVQTAVQEVVNSGQFVLSAANNQVDPDSQKDVNAFSERIIERTTEVIANPVFAFMDKCKARDMDAKKISDFVKRINVVFSLTDSTNYDDILTAVAQYMEENPQLYERIRM